MIADLERGTDATGSLMFRMQCELFRQAAQLVKGFKPGELTAAFDQAVAEGANAHGAAEVVKLISAVSQGVSLTQWLESDSTDSAIAQFGGQETSDHDQRGQ